MYNLQVMSVTSFVALLVPRSATLNDLVASSWVKLHTFLGSLACVFAFCWLGLMRVSLLQVPLCMYLLICHYADWPLWRGQKDDEAPGRNRNATCTPSVLLLLPLFTQSFPHSVSKQETVLIIPVYMEALKIILIWPLWFRQRIQILETSVLQYALVRPITSYISAILWSNDDFGTREAVSLLISRCLNSVMIAYSLHISL